METSSSSAATFFTRARVSAAITGGALLCVSLYVLRQSFRSSPEIPLRRRNAIRRHGRDRERPTVSSEALEATIDALSGTPSDASPADENNNLRDPNPGADDETVLNDEQTIEDDWNEQWGLPPQRAGQNIVGLLFRVSEDNARRNAYVHRGCMCNACGMVPIRGIRYRCANCSDFDLCETCESQGLHNKNHVFYKVRIPAPPFGPKSMQPVWYPGDPDSQIRNIPRVLMNKLSENTGFERPELEAFWEQWTYIANTEWRDDPDELLLAMDRKTFERCLVPSGGHRRTAPNLIHDRMFAFYDTNNDDLISFREFLYGLSYRKRKDKLKRIFNGYDIDGDGLVSRRDFLRIFRAYYVLYKHMHRDILEGLDVQVMNTTETHQLVTSRQPLSGHFGREGRVPEADHGRPMEGKIFHGNGDVIVTDDKSRVVNDDSPDIGDRGEILSTLFNRRGGDDLLISGSTFSPGSEHVQSPIAQTVAHIYRDALLDPPRRVEELPALLLGQPRNVQLDELISSEGQPQQNGQNGTSSEGGGSSDVETATAQENGTTENTEPSETPDLPTGDGVSTRQRGNEIWTNRVPTESQLRARHAANIAAQKQRQVINCKVRVAVRKKLFDRWKKRQFFLDEDEGAHPPDGWIDEDDILANVDINGAAESSKAEQPFVSARSRSSSKVRFAEDNDDYEIRSNPSTSSRSVPERWGGMDIPDSERDVGKEVLYSVTQQSFNELLDVLFKSKEDLAIRAAETKDDRRIYRHLFESIDLAAEAQAQNDEQDSWTRPTISDENTRIQDQTLDELLTSSGYTVDRSAIEPIGVGEPVDATSADSEEVTQVEASAHNPLIPDDAAHNVPHRDPTMPQFRPNSDAELQKPWTPTSHATNDFASSASSATGLSSPGSSSSEHPTEKKKGKKKEHFAETESSSTTPIPHSTLIEWKKLDMAEEEARKRGGWGKLDFAEFEEIWKTEDHGPQRLEYLGTWIDFCIP